MTLAKLANVTATIGVVDVDAIFDAAYASAFDLSMGTKPVLRYAASDVLNVVPGTPVAVGGLYYTVAEVQPDGTGLVLLVLEKV